ncbi:P-loop containing nucleoside triphosphate hydrolase protein [Rhizophagus clarus]|uniref:P-loop containing nucleoside triphosphate hydrolase protein n=1 Tax=Rhizophagus clarus TaxID=94130 RepID=A0A8H3QR06_9GLOM|nr:P-loop containing nucleoside triphosphate hydrolase protein [Rhizophagus clarus]
MDRENEPMSETDILPSVDVVKKGWKKHDVIIFLQRKDLNLDLDDEDIEIIRSKKIGGKAFLSLTKEELESYGLQPGPALAIAELVKEIKGEKEQPVAVVGKKRQITEELTTSTSKKKKWMVNSAMRENDWFTHYFVDPIHQEQNLQLHEKIIDRSFTILYGTRAFGKSTRVLRTISQLEKEGYICSYVNFEQIGVFDTNFWSSLGTSIYVHNRGKLFKSCVEIKNSRDFLLFFSKATWEGPEDKRVVLFFDEFDKMYTIDEKIRNEFLQILRSIRNDINSYAIQAIFAIGTFAILHIDSRFSEASNSNLTSPFNIKDSIHNPNFTLDQVQALYTEFGKDNIITIEMGVIQDIHTRTNGHAGLVCLCGRAIENHLISLLDNNRIISIDLWERFSVNELIEEMPTMKKKLSSTLLHQYVHSRLPECMWMAFSIGQWHMISYRDDGNNRRQHNYSDIVITSRRQKIVLELLATATKGNLDEHFGRALNYARILSANETWIVHFTCEDDFIFDPYWPSDDILRNGLNVLHIWHDLSFKKFKTIACWWSNSKNFKRVTSIKTYPVQG